MLVSLGTLHFQKMIVSIWHAGEILCLFRMFFFSGPNSSVVVPLVPFHSKWFNLFFPESCILSSPRSHGRTVASCRSNVSQSQHPGRYTCKRPHWKVHWVMSIWVYFCNISSAPYLPLFLHTVWYVGIWGGWVGGWGWGAEDYSRD